MPRQQGGGKYKTLTGKLQCSLLLKGTLWFRSQWRRATLKKKKVPFWKHFYFTLVKCISSLRSELRCNSWSTEQLAPISSSQPREMSKKYAKKKKNLLPKLTTVTRQKHITRLRTAKQTTHTKAGTLAHTHTYVNARLTQRREHNHGKRWRRRRNVPLKGEKKKHVCCKHSHLA